MKKRLIVAATIALYAALIGISWVIGTRQAATLPAEVPDSRHAALAASMTPARDIGGDFYDFFPLDSRHGVFLVADVSGKGITAALYMMTAKTIIKDTLLSEHDISAAITKVNKDLSHNNPANMFLTAWIGVMMVKKIADSVSYERKLNRNFLSVVKDLHSARVVERQTPGT